MRTSLAEGEELIHLRLELQNQYRAHPEEEWEAAGPGIAVTSLAQDSEDLIRKTL